VKTPSSVHGLYERYGYAVHQRCLRLLGSESDADDALQEVFVRVMKYGDGFRGESELGWLYRIADRHCLDVLARRKRLASPEESERHLRQEVPASAPSIEDTHLLGQTLAACKQRVQQIALLYYVDEMTQEEVAAQVGVSRKTVKEKLAQFQTIAKGVFGS
jgi:RNA polymerase sigma factor (sigma-70 family)